MAPPNRRFDAAKPVDPHPLDQPRAAAGARALFPSVRGNRDADSNGVGTGPTTPPAGIAASPAVGELVALVNILATALRNIAIYPSGHPRFAASAADLLAGMLARTQGCRPFLIGQRDNKLLVDNEPVAATAGQPAWLLQRFRDAGLRGVAFTADCTVADLIEFGTALTRARKGTPLQSLWPADHAHVRVHDLVFAGNFRDSSPDGEAPLDPFQNPTAESASDPGEQDGKPSAAKVPLDATAREMRRVTRERLAADTKVQAQLAELEAGCAKSANEPGQEFDVLAAVTGLLPADVATQPDLVVETVKKVLDQMAAELPALLQGNAHVRGADVLRIAMGVARKYFHTEAPRQAAPKNLPSGLPQDEAIQANLTLLQQELAAMTAEQCPQLPAATELMATAPQMATELLGVHLHTFANTTRPEVKAEVRQRLVQMLAELDQPRTSVLVAYLGNPAEPPPAGASVRSELLKMLLEAGQIPLLRRLGHIDAAFITKSFPESLWLAARVLDKTPAGLAILRQGLESLALLLASGGTDAAMKVGVLRDPIVVAALLGLGGSVALPLLQGAAQTTPEIRRLLVTHLLGMALPAGEAAALRSIDPPEAVPVAYLRDLLRAVSLDRFDAKLRAATGALLRDAVTNGRQLLPHGRLLEAIARLRHAPGPETQRLLGSLATQGRFWQFDGKARAVRRCAQQLLHDMATRGSA
jgi:hypothetical protein